MSPENSTTGLHQRGEAAVAVQDVVELGLTGRDAGMVLVADDVGAWLVALLADASRKRLTTAVRGTDQQRALRRAAKAAVQLTADELRPDAEGAEQVAMVVNEVFSAPVPDVPMTGQATLLEALQASVAGQLAPLDDPSLTETEKSSLALLDIPAALLAKTLTGHLVREIVVRGARGGPLAPLAAQLNADKNLLQGQRIEDILGRLDNEVRKALARLDTTHSLAAAPVALAQLPALPAGFTGRERELKVLTELLDPAGASGAVVVWAVAGLAGVGKTGLAVAAGHIAQQRGWFPGGILFIDLHGYDAQRVEAAQALDALLRGLGVEPGHFPPGVEERAGLYRSVLAEIPSAMLVIADNASAEAQVQPLLPGGGPHRVLVTSRHTLAGLEARLLDVTELDDTASVKLLDTALRLARPEDDRVSNSQAAAVRMAQMCGGLPLALQIVASLLKADPAYTMAEVADDLTAEQGRLERLQYDDGSGRGTSSVAAAFELSYRRLDAASARIFRLLPVNPGPDVSTAAVAVLADLPLSRLRRELAGLTRAHLIEAASGAAGRWRMHDLLRLYAQRLSDEGADADGREQGRDRLLDYYLNTARVADSHLMARPDTPVSDAFKDQAGALAWLDVERLNLIAAVTMAADTGRTVTAMWLPVNLARYFDRRQRYDDKLATSVVSLYAARRLGDRKGEAIALTNAGAALDELRRSEEAVAAHKDALAIFREISFRPGEGGALNNLGLALQGLRRFEEAVAAHENAVAIFQELGDRPNEGMALNSLGLALREVGRFEDAITALEQDAVICRETGDRHGEGVALNNLGIALQGAQRLEDAAAAHQDAVAIHREIGDRHGEGRALSNLGIALQGLQRWEEAIAAHRDAVAIFQETGDRLGEGNALDNLGVALSVVGRLGEAIAAHQDAIAIYQEVDAPHDEAIALGNLERTQAKQQR